MSGWVRQTTRQGVSYYERPLGGGRSERWYPSGSEIRTGNHSGATCSVSDADVSASPSPRATPELRFDHSGVEIQILPEVVDAIVRSTVLRPDLEQAGWLTGTGTPETIVVTSASDSSRENTPESVELDSSELLWTWKLGEVDPGAGLIGSWHSHPDGYTMPSSPDMRGWASHFTYVREGQGRWEEHIVGLIVDARAENFSAWVLSRQDGQPVVEPASITWL